jgi:hypothetical protein
MRELTLMKEPSASGKVTLIKSKSKNYQKNKISKYIVEEGRF